MQEQYQQELDELKDRGEAPQWFTLEGYLSIRDKHLLPGETVRGMFTRVATGVEEKIGFRLDGLGQDIFTCLWQGFIGLATPVAANFNAGRGFPVSCFTVHVPDTIEGIYDSVTELGLLSKYGGGVGIYYGDVRGSGAAFSDSGTSNGVIPWASIFDKAVSATNQGGVRRGSAAHYLPVDHPDVWALLESRNELQGDPASKLKQNIALTVPDSFIERLIAGDENTVLLWDKILKTRLTTGSPYLIFIDTVNRLRPEGYVNNGLRVHTSNLCSEILLHTDEDHTLVCILSSLNLDKWDIWKDMRSPNTGLSVVELGIYMLEAVCTGFIDSVKGLGNRRRREIMQRALNSAIKGRAIGLGVMGYASLCQKRGIPFSASDELNREIFSQIQWQADTASRELAIRLGEPLWCRGTGMRHTHRTAIAPTMTNSVIAGANTQGIEPATANYYTGKMASGNYIRKNTNLQSLLADMDRDTDDVWSSIHSNMGSVQHLDFLSDHDKRIYLTAREIDQLDIVRLAAARQRYIDQGQSLNLFVEHDVDATEFARMHLQAWKQGVTALYYVRSTSSVNRSSNITRLEAVVYGRDGCPYCRQALELLESHGYGVQYTHQPEGTVPQIYLGGRHIGGYSDLVRYFAPNEVAAPSAECSSCEG